MISKMPSLDSDVALRFNDTHSGSAPFSEELRYYHENEIQKSAESIVETTDTVLLSELNNAQFQILLPSFVMVCILLLVGVSGNAVALVVYGTHMKRSTASYFIRTLAVSDLTNCIVTLPIETYLLTHFWTFDIPWLCMVSRYTTAAMNNTSSFILVAIALERFRSICTPLKPKFTNTSAKVICLTISLVALASALPMAFAYGTFTAAVVIGNKTVIAKTCLIKDDLIKTSYPQWLLVYFFIGHIIVFLIMVTLYSCIAKTILTRSKFQEPNRPPKSKSTENISLQRKSSASSLLSLTVRTNLFKYSFKETLFPPEFHRKASDASTLTSNSQVGNCITRTHGGKCYRKSRFTCMIFMVTFLFEISFIPYLVIVSLRNVSPDFYNTLPDSGKMVYQLLLRFYLINSALNPIVYCFYNQNFRYGIAKFAKENSTACTNKPKIVIRSTDV